MSKSTILIIEDDPMNREGMHILLEEEGYQVMEAESGKQDLELRIAKLRDDTQIYCSTNVNGIDSPICIKVSSTAP